MIERAGASSFDAAMLRTALIASLAKLDPRVQVRNPVRFVVEVGAVITTIGWLDASSAAATFHADGARAANR